VIGKGKNGGEKKRGERPQGEGGGVRSETKRGLSDNHKEQYYQGQSIDTIRKVNKIEVGLGRIFQAKMGIDSGLGRRKKTTSDGTKG